MLGFSFSGAYSSYHLQHLDEQSYNDEFEPRVCGIRNTLKKKFEEIAHSAARIKAERKVPPILCLYLLHRKCNIKDATFPQRNSRVKGAIYWGGEVVFWVGYFPYFPFLQFLCNSNSSPTLPFATSEVNYITSCSR